MGSGSVPKSSTRSRAYLATLEHNNPPDQLRVHDVLKRCVDVRSSPLTIPIMQSVSVGVKRSVVCMAMDPVTPAVGVAIICSALLNRSVEVPCRLVSPDLSKMPRLWAV